MLPRFALFVTSVLAAVSLRAQSTDTVVPHHVPPCPSCAEWNAPHAPFRVYGNTYYVGTDGLASILITSDSGDVLIDGALPESAPRIIDNIRALGFRIEDVKLILNSHVHFDHAGGIAMLQQRSGAEVAASPPSAAVLRAGSVALDDPQYGIIEPIAPVARVRVVRDGETLHVGPLALTAHFTPGHTRGGTSWSWKSCEGARCENIVYADSQTPVSVDGFLFTRNTVYPNAVSDFERGQALLETLPCDILLTPHPGASSLWERVAKRDAGEADALIDTSACRDYAARSRAALAARIAAERASQ